MPPELPPCSECGATGAGADRRHRFPCPHAARRQQWEQWVSLLTEAHEEIARLRPPAPDTSRQEATGAN